mmetsp:Transcript_20713/g.31745  ORF Transcript_20713/g.31745 Transcript_20713/m.31745 type:complete len:296 (+) Transcript_20713:6339-7226(+)
MESAFHFVVHHLAFQLVFCQSVVLRLLLFMSLSEFGIDNCQGQVQQEEGADEDEGHEVDEDDVAESLLHLPLDVTPPLQGHALEHLQQRVEQVVEVGDSEVRVIVRFATEIASWALVGSANQFIGVHLSSLDRNATVLQDTSEQLATTNGEDDEEEEQDDHGISQQGDSGEQSLHQDFESLDTRNGLQGPQHSEHSETRETEACVFLGSHRGLGFSRSEEGEVTDEHDHEIEDIPGVHQVGVFRKEEAHANDFEHHFDRVEGEEDVLGHLESWQRVCDRGIIENHDQTIGQNDRN